MSPIWELSILWGREHTGWPYPEDKAVTLHIPTKSLKLVWNLAVKALGLCPFSLTCKVMLDKSYDIYESFNFFMYKNRSGSISDFLHKCGMKVYIGSCLWNCFSLWEVLHMGKTFMLLEWIESQANETIFSALHPIFCEIIDLKLTFLFSEPS